MLFKILRNRPPTVVEYPDPQMLSDEDNEILSIMGITGLKLKYQLKEMERKNEVDLEVR